MFCIQVPLVHPKIEAQGKGRKLPNVPAEESAIAAIVSEASGNDLMEVPPQPAPRSSLTGSQDLRSPSKSPEPIYGVVDKSKKKKHKQESEDKVETPPPNFEEAQALSDNKKKKEKTRQRSSSESSDAEKKDKKSKQEIQKMSLDTSDDEQARPSREENNSMKVKATIEVQKNQISSDETEAIVQESADQKMQIEEKLEGNKRKTSTTSSDQESDDQTENKQDKVDVGQITPVNVKEVEARSLPPSDAPEPLAGMKFKISPYSEFKPVIRKSASIMKKIEMFSHCPIQPIDMRKKYCSASVTDIRLNFDYPSGPVPQPLVTSTSSFSLGNKMKSDTIKVKEPVQNIAEDIIKPTSFVDKIKQFEKVCIDEPSVGQKTKNCAVKDMPTKPISIVMPQKISVNQEKASLEKTSVAQSVFSPDHEHLPEIILEKSSSPLKTNNSTHETDSLSVSPPNLLTVPCGSITILDTDPDQELSRSEAELNHLRHKLEAEVEKAIREIDRDITSPHIVPRDQLKGKQIANFAKMVNHHNRRFLEELGTSPLNKFGFMDMGKSLYDVEESMLERYANQSRDNIDLKKVASNPNLAFEEFEGVGKLQNSQSEEKTDIKNSASAPILSNFSREEMKTKVSLADNLNLQNSCVDSKHPNSRQIEKVPKTVSFEENEKWNTFLKSMGRNSIELDDAGETFL